MNVVQEYEFHEACLLFPLMEEAELQELADDIKQNGLKEPIALLDGKVIDGRNRLRACEIAQVEPMFTNIQVESPTSYVISKNLKRRHLTISQKAAIAARAIERYAAEAQERQVAAGTPNLKQFQGKDQLLPRGSNWSKSEKNRDLTHSDQHLSQGTAAAQVAREFDVSERTVARALVVKEADPELFEKMERGEVSAKAAEREVREKKRRKPGRTKGSPFRSDQSAPYVPDTPRKKAHAEGQMKRLATAVFSIDGCVATLHEVDFPMAVSVADDEQVKTWISMLKRNGGELVEISKKLLEANKSHVQSVA